VLKKVVHIVTARLLRVNSRTNEDKTTSSLVVRVVRVTAEPIITGINCLIRVTVMPTFPFLLITFVPLETFRNIWYEIRRTMAVVNYLCISMAALLTSGMKFTLAPRVAS
jgi:hypothetical protein